MLLNAKIVRGIAKDFETASKNVLGVSTKGIHGFSLDVQQHVQHAVFHHSNRNRPMQKLHVLSRTIRATMLLSLGVLWGIAVCNYSEEISSDVNLVVFFLIPICAFATLLLNYLDRRNRESDKH